MYYRPRRSRSPAKLHANLSARERSVMDLVIIGKTNRQIAHRLLLKMSTIRTHMENIHNKLGALNRAHAAVLYVSLPRPTAEGTLK